MVIVTPYKSKLVLKKKVYELELVSTRREESGVEDIGVPNRRVGSRGRG